LGQLSLQVDDSEGRLKVTDNHVLCKNGKYCKWCETEESLLQTTNRKW